MPDAPEVDPAENTETPAEPTEPKAPAKPQTLEELLADLDEDRRKVILEQVAKPRQEAKNLRDRVKAMEPKAAEYDRLAAASRTAEEIAQAALDAANQRATAATLRIARAEVKAALAGVVDNPDEIVDDLNLARFVDDDGEVDETAVAALRAKYARFSTAAAAPRAPRPDGSQASGANGKKPATPAEEFASFIKQATAR